MTKSSRPLRLTACAAVCAAGALAALPAGAAAPYAHAAATVVVGDPLAGNHGFGVVTEQDALLGSTGSEGPVAVGGDLSFGPGFTLGRRTAGTFTAPGDARPTALLVGGRIAYTASSSVGVLKVLSDGHVKIGDLTGGDVVTRGADGAAADTRLTATGTGHDSTPRIELTTRQPADSVGPAPGLLDPAALFGAHRDRADALAGCAPTVAPAGTGRVTLDGDRTNVLRLTGEQLNRLSALTFPRRPTASGPVVIDVDTTATGSVLTWDVPDLAGIGRSDAPYVLWNFADATHLTIADGGTVEGTIYAPRAHLTDRDPDAIDGSVVVRSLTAGPLDDLDTRAARGRGGAQRTSRAPANAGEIHHVPFSAHLACDGGPTPKPTPTPTPTPTRPETPAPSTPPHPTAPTTPLTPGLAESGTSARTYAAATLAVLSTVAGLLLVRRFRR
ncbi:collagen-binding domain-containing protein [Streptomyces sp. NPDC048266]|uniref:collagen-binding domain-containing protein n=1 Tax=Streptomyces sp. NPDC048266 TaxID=3155787 RepID=UPI0033D3DB2E